MYEWLPDLVALLRDVPGEPDVIVCTHPHKTPESYSGKRKWLNNVIGWKGEVFMCQDKWRLAKPGVVLIDDNNDNCDQFVDHGGRSILFPQPWNNNHELTEGRLQYVSSQLESMQSVSSPPAPTGTILEEAVNITSKDRQGDYGHPIDHFRRTIGSINAVFSHKIKEPFLPEDWPIFMILDKCSRMANKPKRDNLTDMAGYSRTCEMVLAHEGLEGFVP
jgi:hypothetical protein